MAFTVRTLLSLAHRIARVVGTSPAQPGTRRSPVRRSAPARVPARRASAARRSVVLAYSPSADGRPDPGEIVWTWVPYEEDPAQGKDRPVLLIGTSGGALLGLMLTSRDRNNARDHDDRYVDIGTGAWDRQGRPSEVKVDRLLRIEPGDIRREGAVLPRHQFERVIAAVPAELLA
ncbi:type II toxin-antitoxin system PemK/MazF family toxin [Arthrobacter agilis]|uniref:type II toxin-antitoxin system PemK/MazF family toxin n=1 Tax=Arthrobacter agilis TaxID=37921 RepID=UPI0023666A8C|nr:type II toxin-antitoxin system PemK/MazF family toxin [Arthrobacter agilis]WDF31899.1 type II toxin-antitoxin system PemK/MazF family toxin [Arthrobacter agilis]